MTRPDGSLGTGRVSVSLMDTAVAASVASTLLRFVAVLQTIFVARALGPAEAGLLGLSSLFVTLVSIVTSMFETASLTGSSDADEAYAAAAFRMRLGGAVLGVAAGLAYIAFAHESSSLRMVLAFQMWLPMLEALSSRERVLLQRRLEMHKLIRVSLVIGLSQFVFSCGVLLAGLGVLSLVLVQLAAAALLLALLRRAVRLPPMAPPAATLLREVGANALRIAAGGLPQILGTRTDNLMVVSTLGTGAMAVYSLAYGAVRLPNQIVEWVASTVLLPTLARGAAVGSTEFLATRAVTVGSLVAPLAAAALWFLAPLSLQILDPRWVDVVPSIQIMALGVLMVPLQYVLGTTLIAIRKPHTLAVAGVLVIVLHVLAVPPAAARWGLRGAAWVDVGTVALSATSMGAMCLRYGHLVSVKALAQTARTAVLILIGWWAGSSVTHAVGGPVTGPVVGFATCAVTFIALALVTGSRSLLIELLGSVRRVFRSPAGPSASGTAEEA